jgi:sigma-B regulation protein RsbU (phosphoserine phosphatase)
MAEHSILVVEDEHTLRRLLEYRLSKHYAVRTAANGEEALTLVHEDVPDLIVSDIMMPKMDGFALQKALQRDKDTRIIPFIFLTAKADESSRLKGLRMGVDDYITKPFDIEQLLTRIERLLERTKLFQSRLDARLGQDFSEKLMPKSAPAIEGYRVCFKNIPREQGGGDLLDWTEVNDGSVLFTVGDVMGKGVQAKFYAFSFLAYVRSMLHGLLTEVASPAALLHRLNRMLMQDDFMQNTFASLLLMRWDVQNDTITYANAGHCRPLLVTPDGVEIATHSDMILGLDQDTSFQDTALPLEAGHAFFAYTDGLMEQKQKDGTMLGEEGVQALAAQAYGTSQPLQTVLDQALAKSDSDTFADDILLVWIEHEA